jgi:hypothetical protein
MTDRRGRKASSALVACVLAVTALTACESDKEPDVSSTPNPSSQGELICGFVPKSEVAAMVGSTDLFSTGTAIEDRGSEVSWGNCFVRIGTGTVSALEVSVDSAHTNSIGATYVKWAKEPKPGRQPFPAANPTGFSEPKYGFTPSPGEKVRTGAFAAYVRGDWFITIRNHRPAAGRDAVADAAQLAQSIATTLQLPEAPATPYASPTPAN